MKYFHFLIPALLLTGCIKNAHIEFTGTTPGIKNGVFIIKNTADSTVFGENIKDGKFTLTNKLLKEPGYYSMNITGDDTTDKHEPFEVYLENGKYTIETEAGKLYKYPKITSSSKKQEQLSAFYTLSDQLSSTTKKEVESLNAEIKSKGNALSQMAYTQLLNKLSAAENKMVNTQVDAFRQFVKQYPNSDISTHLMLKLNYEDDPVSFYDIYKTLSPAAKASDDGKEVGEKLSHLIKLVTGVKAPAIEGKAPTGKPFDPKSISAKLILVDFWRASDEISRTNHKILADILRELKDPKKLAVLSVSLDSKSSWWTTAIGDDNLTWTQISDLKGDDSPNAVNWSVTKIPTYYLLDGNWTIVERDINIESVDMDVKEYLSKHP